MLDCNEPASVRRPVSFQLFPNLRYLNHLSRPIGAGMTLPIGKRSAFHTHNNNPIQSTMAEVEATHGARSKA
jgi:hypothetical protein